MRNSDGLPRLIASLDRLERAFPASYAVTPRNLVGRLVVLGYHREVLEAARATVLLVQSDVPRAAFACSRAAFEAFQDVLYLVKGSDPPLNGARCRVAELLDNHLTQNRGREATSAAIGAPPVLAPWRDVDDVIQEEAAFIDRLQPTAGQILWDALELVRAARERRRWHWSGLNREELVAELERILAGKGNAQIMRVFYDILSRQTHAAPRCYPPFMEIDEKGNVHLMITASPAEAEFITGPAIGSAIIAVESLTALEQEVASVLD